jgi:hypothetical protein
MKQFKNQWFSSLEDLREEIEEETDYLISELNSEYITIAYSTEDDEDVYETYRIGGTERTIYIDLGSKRTEIFR